MISRPNLKRLIEFLSSRIGEGKTELAYSNPYTFAIAVLLSAQSTDKSVNISTAGLFKVADSPEKMLALGEDRLREMIKRTGFYNVKARNIMKLSKVLLERHGGRLPLSGAVLESLPGLGRKSANVVMNELSGAPLIGVDTHVMRLSRRLDLVPPSADTPLKVERALQKTIPAEFHRFVSNWLVLFGRYDCKAVRPKCALCPIRDMCKEPAKTK
jgi:endonuclease-3